MDHFASLTAFNEVVECGGFSAAARRLDTSVTTVSNHVQALEERLGVRLLNRTTRKVSLTDIGKAYYERSTHILKEVDEADRIASSLQATPRGALRLHTNAHIVRFLSPIVSEFLVLYPEVSIDLTVGEKMPDLIDEGFDMAIRTISPPDSSLIARRLTPWRHILCCSPGYLERNPIPTALHELTRHNCLRYAFYPYGDEWRFEGPDGGTTSVRVSGNAVSNNGEVLRDLAMTGHGVFLAPSFNVAADIATGNLVRLLPDHQPVEFSINVIYPHRHHLSTKVRSFIDLLAARFAEHREWMTTNVLSEDMD
ncbi:LysR family transcriptional regulator [Roseixanthobacter glucoisosaccharinicivorans]|uniref:LysR family transcriptional regulator n=1 Tax=Roseixanthobacter glucoisosaccharinicivorans TaxID=3119923 RepID=UPI00372B1A4A